MVFSNYTFLVSQLSSNYSLCDRKNLEMINKQNPKNESFLLLIRIGCHQMKGIEGASLTIATSLILKKRGGD